MKSVGSNPSKLGQLLVISIGILTAASGLLAAEKLPLERIQLPAGFQISLFAEVPNARSLTLSPNGTLFVGSQKAGRVYSIQSRGGEREVRKPIVVAERLNMPNGVAFKDGALYVAEVNRVLRFDGIESRLLEPPKPVVVNDQWIDGDVKDKMYTNSLMKSYTFKMEKDKSSFSPMTQYAFPAYRQVDLS